jgi:UDP-N-acetylmuramate dehydrogenase
MSLAVLQNVKLAKYTSWLIGGDAEFFCLPETIEDLKQAITFSKQNQLKITVLGGGSNVLISDSGIKGLTICLKNFSHTKVTTANDNLYVEVLSGTSKSELLKIFLKYKSTPALFLAGLPGDVGGGVVMNAGVAENFEPREFMQLVDWIEVIDQNLQIRRIEKSDLKISYRHTDGWQPHIITTVAISWPIEGDGGLLQKVKDANLARLSKQPLDLPSCGSVFKNPVGYKAAQLIDQCGLKGYQIGDAQVSLKHANFIVNLNAATATDTWDLIMHVQKTVFEKKQIQLTTEVVRLGEWV